MKLMHSIFPTPFPSSTLRASRAATLAAALSAVLAISLPAASPAHAQTPSTDSTKFGDWIVQCRAVGQDNSERCLLSQNIILRQSGKRVLNIAVARPAKDKPFVFGITAPLGILLAAGLTLEIDEKELVRVPLRLCNVNGCQGSFPVSDDVRKLLAGGETGRVIFRQPNGRPLRVEFSLKGFEDAFRDLEKK